MLGKTRHSIGIKNGVERLPDKAAMARNEERTLSGERKIRIIQARRRTERVQVYSAALLLLLCCSAAQIFPFLRLSSKDFMMCFICTSVKLKIPIMAIRCCWFCSRSLSVR